MSRRFLSLFLLFAFSLSYLSAQDITIPIEEYQSMRGELQILLQELILLNESVTKLKANSEEQTTKLQSYQTRIENLQTRIKELLSQLEISDQDYQDLLTDYEALLTDSMITIDNINRENKVLKKGLVVVGVLAFIVGIFTGFKISEE